MCYALRQFLHGPRAETYRLPKVYGSGLFEVEDLGFCVLSFCCRLSVLRDRAVGG